MPLRFEWISSRRFFVLLASLVPGSRLDLDRAHVLHVSLVPLVGRLSGSCTSLRKVLSFDAGMCPSLECHSMKLRVAVKASRGFSVTKYRPRVGAGLAVALTPPCLMILISIPSPSILNLCSASFTHNSRLFAPCPGTTSTWVILI